MTNPLRAFSQAVPQASAHSKFIPNGFWDSAKFQILPTPKIFTNSCGSRFDAGLRRDEIFHSLYFTL